ncbi:hypothetical protein DY120_01915 [Apilactobacillus micheneri]|uniref:t-SNARE coiled-coil homology domain-containing protein n=1 Tax=Apilactobacillus micheneri TaxID=1899430 RepID=A0ABY2Z0X7_9LACO|nr:hypothetical protein [Apilactobacillus micheneri]TPR26474.1 hypothetical protein DY114_01915 [Apilactobacillus micheneri]TPR27228.1 hypothetical protein DY111_01915 [Apilactobacillus micheneri]TPR27475.1 hypothetical protein DY113_06865 [Apilactobacillus micheneri]TPR31991.1 hypothetical protein DY117_01915 [Apilactobacillus micheneri]TPR32395.1 hypothetical protein DY120_01915 [Apilactobacillus micheneri]
MSSEITSCSAIDYLNDDADKQKFVDKIESIVKKFENKEYGDILSNDNESFHNDFNELLEVTKKIKSQLVPYSQVTRIMYKFYSDNTDGSDILVMLFSSEIEKSIKECNDKYILYYHEILIKCVEHMKLAFKQMDSLYYKQQSKLDYQKQQIDKQEKNLEKYLKTIKKTKKKLKKVYKMKDNIYIQFVSILSIFSAIIFSLFSAAKMVTTSFSQLSNNVPVHRIMMFTSLTGMAILSIIFLLLKFVATLADKEVDKPLKISKFTIKCPTYTIGMLILLLIFVLTSIYDKL